MSKDSVQLDDLTRGFLSESREMLDEVEPTLIELGQRSMEQGMVDEETVNLVFRLFHSLKGSAGFFQFSSVVGLTHIAETLLDLFRSGQSQMAGRHTDALCRACDVVSLLLDQVEATGSDAGYEVEVEKSSKELMALIDDETKDRKPAPRPKASPPNDSDLPKAAEEGNSSDSPAPLPKATEEEETADLMPLGDFLEKFIQEADEQLDQVEQALLEYEQDPSNFEPVREAYRALHSFKGNCGMLGFEEMERLSHMAESVWEAIKDGQISLDKVNATLLHVVDVLRNAVADISQGGDGDIEHLNLLLDMLGDIAPLPETDQGSSPFETGGREKDEQPYPPRAEIKQTEALDLLRENSPLNEEVPSGTNGPAAPDESAFKPRSVVRHDIRVDLRKLDQLINLVGEMVIAESMVTRNPDLDGYEFENFEKASAHLNKIVRDLQDVALSVRMIPVAGIFRKMIRLVHDLSQKANKKVELKLMGEDTEIDKTVSEQLADPLVHLVRNAIDHGIEPPEERKAKNKPETGELTIEAKHEGGEVWIVIRDDGRGLSREKILKKGLQNDLVKGDGSDLSDEEVFGLIFEPGFSTADKVTDISGRGVGMDVVKKNIEKIKGRADVHSREGKGTTFILRIPLTLAIMEGMLVRVGHALYTIPMLSIRESLRITPGQITKTPEGTELVKVREEIFPVLRLHELHRIEPDHTDLRDGLLVLLETHGEVFSLFVDEILGEEQTVIKGISKYLGEVRGVSGCTILGDGEISLILDVAGLLNLAQGNSKSGGWR